MKTTKIRLFAGFISLVFAGIAQAGVIPYGIQTNVSDAMISSWGWSECSRTGAYTYVSTSNIVSGCSGDYLAMGIWDQSLGAYGVIGIGDFDAVTAITYADYHGDNNGTVQNWSNGLNWYRTAGHGSWGFTTAAETALNSADINLFDGLNSFDAHGTVETTLAAGVSFHLGALGEFNPGWCYNSTGSNMTCMDNTDQRVFWTASAPQAVAPVPAPEPATLALFGMGLAGLGWARRR